MIHPGFEPVAKTYPHAAEAMSELTDWSGLRPIKDASGDTGNEDILKRPVAINSVLASFFNSDGTQIENCVAIFGNDTPAHRLRFVNRYLTLRNKFVHNDDIFKVGRGVADSICEVAPQMLEQGKRLIGSFVVYEPKDQETYDTPSPDAYSTLHISSQFFEGIQFIAREEALYLDEEDVPEVKETLSDIFDLEETPDTDTAIENLNKLRRLDTSIQIAIPRLIFANMPDELELHQILDRIPQGSIVPKTDKK